MKHRWAWIDAPPETANPTPATIRNRPSNSSRPTCPPALSRASPAIQPNMNAVRLARPRKESSVNSCRNEVSDLTNGVRQERSGMPPTDVAPL
eukprot:761005-Alexandrium_andersonii.AAC.1